MSTIFEIMSKVSLTNNRSAMHRPCQNRWLGASKCTFSKQPEGSKAIQYNSLHHILANLNILVHSPEHEHYTLTLVFFDEAQRAVWDFMVEKHRWTIRRGFTVENGFEDSRLLNHYTQLRSKPKPWEVEQTLARFSQDHKNADGFIDYVERVKTHLAKNGTQFTHPRVSKRLWCRVEPDGPGCSPLKSKQCFMMCTNKGCTTFGHAHCLFRVAARLKQSRRRNITFNSNQISSNCAKCRRPLNWTWMRTELSLRMRGAKDIVKLIEARDNEAIAAERRNKAEDKRTAAAERREHKVRARAAKVVEAEAKRARKAATDAARVVEHMKMAEESAKAAKENPDLDLEVYTYRNKTKPPGVGKRAEKAAQRRKEELEKAEKEAELQAEADAKAAEEEAEFEERRALGVLRFEDLERKRVLTKENGIEIQDEIRNPCEHCGTEKRYRYSGDAEDRYSNSQRQEKCEKRWDDLERACYIRLGCEQEMPWWRKRTKSKQVNRDRYQWEDIWDRLLHDETKPGAPGKLSYVERLLLGDQLHHASFAYWLGQKDQWRRPGLKRWQPSPYAIQRWCWSAGITGTKSWINPRTKDIKAVFRDLPKNMTCPKVWAKMHPKKKTSEEVDESRPLTRAQQSELNRQAEEANQREEQRGRENAEFASRMKAVAEHYETPANVPRTTMRLGIPSSSIESHSSSSSEMPGIFAPLATREPLTTPEDRHVHRAIRPSAFRDHSELVFSIFKDVWKLGVTTPQDMPETVDAFAAATFNASSATSPS